MKETVLLFNLQDKDRLLKLEMALFPLHVRLSRIPREDYSHPLGYLAGLKDVPPAEIPYCGGELDGEMLIFAFLNDTRLNQVLAALRKNGVRIPYKAVLTPTNQYWTPLECFEEIRREHEAVAGNKADPSNCVN